MVAVGPRESRKLSELEDGSVKTFAHLMKNLTETQEEGEPLLNRTMVLRLPWDCEFATIDGRQSQLRECRSWLL